MRASISRSRARSAVGRALAGANGARALDHLARLEEIAQLDHRERRERRVADVGAEGDELLARQAGERLAHGGGADAEAQGDRLDHDPVAGRELVVDDLGLEQQVDVLGQAGTGRLRRGARHAAVARGAAHSLGHAIFRADEREQFLDRGLGGGAIERDAAVLQQAHTVAGLEHVQVVVRDHDLRDVAALAQLADQLEDQPALLRAHRRERLVEQDDLGVREDRARDGDRLALAARERRDLGVHVGDVDAERVEVRPRRARIEPLLSTPQARVLALQEHVVEHGQPGHESEVLVDGVDAERARVDDRFQVHRVAEQRDLARVGPVVAREDLDERRLAGAVVADQPEHLALAQVQAHVAQRGDRAEALGEVLDAEHVVGCAVGLDSGRLHDVHTGFPRTRAMRYPSAIESRIAVPMKRSL